MSKKLIPIVVIISAFIALELLLAVANLIVPWDAYVYRAGLQNSQFIDNREMGKPTQYLRDPDVFWRLKPGWFRPGYYVNRAGFRGPEVSREKSPHTTRIICLGNSCTFGGFVDKRDDTYPMKLQAMLVQKYPQVQCEVINAGVNGYTTYQIHKYWQTHVRHFHPDIITVYSGFNNLVYAPQREDKDLSISPLFCLVSNKLLTLRIFRALDAVSKKLLTKGSNGELQTPFDESRGILRRVSPSDYRKNLSCLAEDAQAQKIKVVFMTTPSRHEYPLCLLPRPRMVRNQDQTTVRWQIPYQVGAEWARGVDRSHSYEAELQSALQKIERRPDMPAPYFQAGYCYQHLGQSDQALKYYAKSDSLDEDHQNLKLYNQIMRKVAQRYGLPLVDCERVFSEKNIVDLFVDDGIHPNVAGQAVIAEALFPVIDALIAK